ncbi:MULTISPECIES: DUF6055 domain-containing protein [Chitinophagaceae]
MFTTGAIAHELGHVFQSFVIADGGVGFSTTGQSMYEMTSQYMLWQVYPEWLTFENYHLKAFLNLTHLAFLHEDNMYHSPFVLEYWSEKHGQDFVGKLWRSAQKGEDAVMTYKRINLTICRRRILMMKCLMPAVILLTGTCHVFKKLQDPMHTCTTQS